MTGNLTHEGDNDWFMVDLRACLNDTFTIETINRSSGLVAALVIYIYRSIEGLPVGGVPRINTDSKDAGHWPRVLRNGAERISNIDINNSSSDYDNDEDIYWIRVRPNIPSQSGTYSHKVTRK